MYLPQVFSLNNLSSNLESDGLIAVVDYKQKNRIQFPAAVSFNAVGDSFLVSDSRGAVTLFNLGANRYTTLAADLKGGAPSAVTFLGKQNQQTDLAFIACKDKAV